MANHRDGILRPLHQSRTLLSLNTVQAAPLWDPAPTHIHPSILEDDSCRRLASPMVREYPRTCQGARRWIMKLPFVARKRSDASVIVIKLDIASRCLLESDDILFVALLFFMSVKELATDMADEICYTYIAIKRRGTNSVMEHIASILKRQHQTCPTAKGRWQRIDKGRCAGGCLDPKSWWRVHIFLCLIWRMSCHLALESCPYICPFSPWTTQNSWWPL